MAVTEGVRRPVRPDIVHVRRAAYVPCGYEQDSYAIYANKRISGT